MIQKLYATQVNQKMEQLNQKSVAALWAEMIAKEELTDQVRRSLSRSLSLSLSLSLSSDFIPF